MSSAATAVPTGPPVAKSPKKAKRKSSGPSVSALILKAVAASSERGGISLPALKKALKAGGYNAVKNNARILAAIKRLLTKKTLVQTKGSFKLNKKPPKPRKKIVKKKTKAKKVKKAGVKKAAGSASPVKKSPKKKRKAKSPKKAKTTTAAKKTKKPKSPKKKSPKKKSPKKVLKKSPKKTLRTRAAAAKK
ncbi:protamine-like protein [Notolabrus celidotus]|uniref:protamine-like protein n=1 Tax=Notolabrus celidotus TaxID=1203425 RepID=UPI001490104E|nr:protamine-like protein [Notolabrus celidotus]